MAFLLTSPRLEQLFHRYAKLHSPRLAIGYLFIFPQLHLLTLLNHVRQFHFSSHLSLNPPKLPWALTH